MKKSTLLKAYLSIWNNRKPNYNEQNAEVILKELIKRELNDENSHPRIRKSRETNFI